MRFTHTLTHNRFTALYRFRVFAHGSVTERNGKFDVERRLTGELNTTGRHPL